MKELFYLLLSLGIPRKIIKKTWLNHKNNYLEYWSNSKIWTWYAITFKKNYNKEDFARDLKNTDLRKLNYPSISIEDNNYPKTLFDLDDTPPILFYQGNIELLSLSSDNFITAIGTRKLNNISDVFLNKILPQNKIYISGFAEGCDNIIHEYGLKNSGTIAVTPYGFDNIPKIKLELTKFIKKDNLLLSEYEPKIKNKKWFFQERNRILAGLSNITVVLASKAKSGTHITVKYALELGRDVYAVPWSPLSEWSEGNNYLIQQGAIPLYDKNQLIDIEIEKNQIETLILSGGVKDIYENISSQDMNIDELMQTCNLPPLQTMDYLETLLNKKLIIKTDYGKYKAI